MIELVKQFGDVQEVLYDKKNRIVVKEVVCIKAPHEKESGRWYMQVSDLDEFEDVVKSIHAHFGVQLDADVVELKMPYRYKRFQLPVVGENGNLLTCYDVKNNAVLDVELSCTVSMTSGVCLVWKVHKIKIHEERYEC